MQIESSWQLSYLLQACAEITPPRPVVLQVVQETCVQVQHVSPLLQSQIQHVLQQNVFYMQYLQ